MNNDAAVVIFFALSALINNNIGLKNIPPPIPTTPETNPKHSRPPSQTQDPPYAWALPDAVEQGFLGGPATRTF